VLSPLKGEVMRLIQEHGTGLVYGTETGRTLAQCVREMVLQPQLRSTMADRARALYRSRFSFETVYGALVSHLERLARQRPAA
jgi:glycosyltransferase involved in cell wall biosynthesis